MAVNWIADSANMILPERLPDKFQSCEPGSAEEAKVNNTAKFLAFALEQKDRFGPYSSPKNRRIVLEDRPDLGGRIVRFVSDET